MRHGFMLLFMGIVLAGCAASRQPVYAFDYAPPHREEWTRTYSTDRETRSLQGTLVNAQTDAKVSVYRDPYHSPTPIDAARIYRIVLERQGYAIPGDGIAVEDGRASFPIEDEAHRLKGEVVAFRVGEERRHVVLVGTWPQENDARARADMRALVANLFVRTVE